MLPAEGGRTVQVIVTPDGDGPARFEAFSREAGGPAEPDRWRLHASAMLRAGADRCAAAPEPLAAIRARLSVPVSVDELYDSFREAGVEFGPGFRGIVELWQGQDESLGRLQLPEALAKEVGSYRLHPVLLDAGFQLLAAARAKGRADEVFLPVGLDRLRVDEGGRPPAWAHARLRTGNNPETLAADYRLFDEDGAVVAEVEGLRLKRTTREALHRSRRPERDEWLHEVAWTPAPSPEPLGSPAEPAGRWLVFVDESGVGASIGRQLAARGESCLLVRPGAAYERGDDGSVRIDPEQPDHFSRLYRAALDGGEKPLRGIVHLWSLAEDPGPTASSLSAAALTSCGSLLHLVQALPPAADRDLPRLWVVTRGAQAVGGTPLSLAQAPAWGLTRTIASERPELRCVSVDLDPSAGDADEHASAVLSELGARNYEDRVAYRGGTRHVARLARCTASPARTRGAAGPGGPVKLEIATRGILDGLRLHPATRQAPGAGEVEVRVLASGLNFRDVLNAMGLYEGPPAPLGSECAGTVVAVGEGVQGLQVGQPVVGMANGTFRTFVTARAELLVPKPEGMSFAEAATVPITFLTAEYALNRLGRMKSGERVLIHAAAGGVGLAAVQLAQCAGAEVFATAGSDEKRAYLRSLGVRHLMDSR